MIDLAAHEASAHDPDTVSDMSSAGSEHVYQIFDGEGVLLETSKPFATRTAMLDQAGRRQSAINVLALQFSSLIGWTVSAGRSEMHSVALCTLCRTAFVNGDILATAGARRVTPISATDLEPCAECGAFNLKEREIRERRSAATAQ